MKGPEFLAWVPVPVCHLLGNGDSDIGNAPHRTGRRRSRARPRFRITQRAGAYPRGSPPGEQGSIPGEQTGSGMDPPVFWAGNTGKSQTTHSIIHEPMRPRNPQTRLSAPCRPKCSQRGINEVAQTEWPFRRYPRRSYFRHKPNVRKRRSRSILRSTIRSSSNSVRRRTSCRRSPQSQGRVAGGRVSSCLSINSISSS